MDVQFIAQPFADGQDLRDFLHGIAHETELTALRASVAWAKRSGLLRMEPAITAIRQRGSAQLIVGISEGGATKQGLRLAMNLADEVFVFHDPAGRTFHPKVYFAAGANRAALLVGSQNLTAGGLYFNYEAAITCRLDLSMEEDRRLAVTVNAFLDRLIADESVCKKLNSALLDSLIADPVYQIGDEDRGRRSPAPTEEEEGAPEDTDSITEEETEGAPVFGRSSQPKRTGLSIALPFRSPEQGPKAPIHRPEPRPSAAASGRAREPSDVVKRWFKKMSASDAQHPPQPTSAVTGNLRLSKAGHPIDHKTYFRQIFFGAADWLNADPGDPTYERCAVDFDVSIRDEHIGLISFRVDYTPRRVANQNNVPTVLKWGDLGSKMRAEDHRGEYVVLEMLANRSYRMSIQAREPDNFLE